MHEVVAVFVFCSKQLILICKLKYIIFIHSINNIHLDAELCIGLLKKYMCIYTYIVILVLHKNTQLHRQRK